MCDIVLYCIIVILGIEIDGVLNFNCCPPVCFCLAAMLYVVCEVEILNEEFPECKSLG